MKQSIHLKQSIYQSTNLSRISQATNRSIERAINQSINQSIKPSISINQPIKQSFNQTIYVNQTINQSIYKPIKQSINHVEIICWDQLWKLDIDIICWDCRTSSIADNICRDQLVKLAVEFNYWDDVEIGCYYYLFKSIARKYRLKSFVEVSCWDYLLDWNSEIICCAQLLKLSVE